MTVKKKAKKEKLADEFICGGGGTTNVDQQEGISRLTLRIPSDLMEKVDDLRDKAVGHTSRNTWILEAIAKRVKKET